VKQASVEEGYLKVRGTDRRELIRMAPTEFAKIQSKVVEWAARDIDDNECLWNQTTVCPLAPL